MDESNSAQAPLDEQSKVEPAPEPVIETPEVMPSPDQGGGGPVQQGPEEVIPEAVPVPEVITEVNPTQNTVTITEIMEPPLQSHSALATRDKQKTLWKSFLEKLTFTKQKKLDRILQFLSEKGRITNDDVEKLLRVSDRTALRYLDLLEKEGRLKQVGKTGKHTYYTSS